MIKIRIMAAAVLMLSVLPITMSCNNGVLRQSGGEVSDDNTVQSQTLKNSSETEAVLDIPGSDFGGYEFRILSRGRTVSGDWYSRDLTVEEQNGDVLNDAIYSRNIAVEDLLNITFKEIDGSWSGSLSMARKSLLAGADDYDALVLGPANDVAPLQADKLLLNLFDAPYLDLSKPWWDSKATGDLSIGNSLYCAIGDLLYVDKDATWAVLFVKQMIKDYGLDNPYMLVKNHKWTFDRFSSMIRDVSADVNGDGVMKYEDRYGLIGQAAGGFSLIDGFGAYSIIKDKNDYPKIAVNNEKYFKHLEDVVSLVSDTNISALYENAASWGAGYNDIYYGAFGSMMDDKRALFYLTVMNRVTKLRGNEQDFGILPLPLYDENQEEYSTPTSTIASNCVSIPITSPDPERTGIIIEAWCAYSTDTVRKAYYDVTLKTKLARDNESSEMLDIIFGTRSYDLGEMYNWGKIYSTIVTMCQKGNTDFAGIYAGLESSALAEITDAVGRLK